jgi:four helix bundle protein
LGTGLTPRFLLGFLIVGDSFLSAVLPYIDSMKENVIRTKSFEFAVAVTQCCRELVDRKEYVLSKQLLRAGTSIGANIREAVYASSRRDFHYRLTVALRESSETMFWLELLQASGYMEPKTFDMLHRNAKELLKILTSITKTTRNKIMNASPSGDPAITNY